MLPAPDYFLRHLSAAWRVMVTGRDEALAQMDLSAEGFWRSFWSLLVALPALAASWVSGDVALAGESTNGTGSLVARLALTDMLVWIVPIILLAAASGPMNIRNRFPAYVITSNWGSALLAWLIVPPALLGGFGGNGGELGEALQFAAIVFSLILGWRLAWAVFGRDAAQASLVFVVVIVLSVMTNVAALQVLGLTLQP